MENRDDRGLGLGENGTDETSDGEDVPAPTEAVITSMAQVEWVDRTLGQAAKLLPGERMGWWSSQRYDKRKRMRALVKGAVDDTRTKILLDTGANVNVTSASFAKKLRVREVLDHGRSLEVRSLGSRKGVQSFLGALNYYSRFIQDFEVYGAALYQLNDVDFEPGVTSPLPDRAS
ncbi:hypothetical protein PR001_g22274 [Phytophthora rubi]|uniref:Peptidase A2 domain-containing protein n=1 Tax=Phytophthora rubi TaxID=129364 RepID=A0A6A3IWX7_9STRA|nr:hypothetical protein PR001_g22274 [Phytophthora rubi]